MERYSKAPRFIFEETEANPMTKGSVLHHRKKMILNKHLLNANLEVEGLFQMPKVDAYKGDIPDAFVPYNAKVPEHSNQKGVYCHLDDYRILSTWNQPYKGLMKVRRYKVAAVPDFTVFCDGLVCENIEQLRRNRTLTRFWQDNGVPTIQSVSWGNADSLGYAFDGLASNSWTALGHQRVGNRSEQRLYRYALEKFIEEKQPIGLIVFMGHKTKRLMLRSVGFDESL